MRFLMTRPHFTRFPFVILILTLFLSACSSVPLTPQQSTNWNKHQTKLQEINEYKVTGKIGYKSPEQRHSLNFQWTQNQDNSELLLTTFLGQTVLKISMNQGNTVVETGDNQTFEGTDPGRLIYGLTGLNMPIAYLGDWIKGLPTAADDFQLNELNTIEHLSKQVGQTNWHLRYNSYSDNEQLLLPNSMTLTQQNTTIKIIASNWIVSQ
ncbi:lipoprotein insertase outer membrane protein LolB [Aliivibrio sp. S4MY2]|uniref:lipoprotein insertase outer membrane protein LolB n=2 Tax=Aliivibrio TaxID=511678 RepID=UPI002379FCC5|nr:lipoprotein insertase outer membrane protein LolB [Aliivibrio sp. S4MY2]MDD9164364.1 lipoprotein insertase outer membrane protein LolB [Aliivibrio sp. S4MY2]